MRIVCNLCTCTYKMASDDILDLGRSLTAKWLVMRGSEAREAFGARPVPFKGIRKAWRLVNRFFKNVADSIHLMPRPSQIIMLNHTPLRWEFKSMVFNVHVHSFIYQISINVLHLSAHPDAISSERFMPAIWRKISPLLPTINYLLTSTSPRPLSASFRNVSTPPLCDPQCFRAKSSPTLVFFLVYVFTRHGKLRTSFSRYHSGKLSVEVLNSNQNWLCLIEVCILEHAANGHKKNFFSL